MSLLAHIAGTAAAAAPELAHSGLTDTGLGTSTTLTLVITSTEAETG